ncbi:hypothetical protein IC006_2490 [Sulfuracidifex tepidarius]|uniref:Uncharacterized protein n=1 Tax=Sulfuracidifex tepidarius TaxID=1294262 RepID=A0A510DY72_9CREN|nr:hypothetical protein [Sulfuracidifex tepidarius]BBG25155.1 hypothetical protein IC006_2490 [Sulfuracidifex tepidarius]
MIKDFPKFDCLITGEKEGYDSEIEVYFAKELQIASIFSILQNYDTEWKENYSKIIEILDKMDNYIVNGKDLPDYTLIKDLDKGDFTYSYSQLQSIQFSEKKISVSLLYYVAGLIQENLYWYSILAKKDKYSKNFNLDAFEILYTLMSVVRKRAYSLSQGN